MKAYVIKNKEGGYKREDIIEYIFKETTSYFSKDIRYADIFTEEEMAKCYCPKDCEVVEITIAEGDLEQEIEEYKTQIKEFCGTKLAKLIDKREQEIRKQVCDEIREKLQMNEQNTCENTAFGVYYDYLKEILDQIEKGEE